MNIENEEPNLTKPVQTWRRPLAYLLLAGGVLLTLFNGDLARNIGLPVMFLQIAALVFLLGGAALFYSVRTAVDRVATYRQAFSPLDEADTTSAETDKSDLPS